MEQLIQSIKTEWSENDRLQLMTKAVLAIMLLYVLVWLNDVRVAMHSEVSSKQRALARIERVQNEPFWYEREKEVLSQSVIFQNKLWKASSQGLAQAEIQALLRSMVDRNRMTNSRITLETVVTEQDGNAAIPVWRVSAQVRASFRGPQLQKVLWDIANSQKLLTIRSLNFALNTNRNSHSNFTMMVDAWFEIPEGAVE